MNSTIVDICLNGITMSTEEYTIGHFSPNGIQQRHRTVPCLFSQYFTGKGLKFYPGLSLDVGASMPQTEGFGIGASVGLDQTVEIASFNLYDEIDSAYIKIMEW